MTVSVSWASARTPKIVKGSLSHNRRTEARSRKPDLKQRNQESLLPSAGFSYKERNEVMDLKILTENTEKQGPNSRGRREEAGLGQVEHSGDGADKGKRLSGPQEV